MADREPQAREPTRPEATTSGSSSTPARSHIRSSAGSGTSTRYSAPDFPGRPGFEGFTLRLFEPKTGLWRIWWASSIGGGQLDEPVVGRFEDDGVGRFECDDILDGVHFRVRYDWHVVDNDTLRWEQSFSFDGRRNWESNWVMDSTRIASPVGGAVAALARV